MTLLTPEQAAEALSISVRHLLYLTKDGEIPFVNVGRGLRMIRRYDQADIQAFIESRKGTETPREATASVRISKPQKEELYKPIDFRALLDERRANRRNKKS